MSNNRYFKTDNSTLHLYYKGEGFETWYITYTNHRKTEKMLFSTEEEAETQFNKMMLELAGLNNQ